MSDGSLYERGMKIRKELWGDEGDERLRFYDEIDPSFSKMVVEIPFGIVWSRPGLDKRTRALCALSMLVALNRPVQTKVYVNACLNLGIPEKEIIEVIAQSAVYAGMPVAIEGVKIAHAVFKERKGKK